MVGFLVFVAAARTFVVEVSSPRRHSKDSGICVSAIGDQNPLPRRTLRNAAKNATNRHHRPRYGDSIAAFGDLLKVESSHRRDHRERPLNTPRLLLDSDQAFCCVAKELVDGVAVGLLEVRRPVRLVFVELLQIRDDSRIAGRKQINQLLLAFG